MRWASARAPKIWRSPPRTATTSSSRCCPPTPSSPACRSPRRPRSAPSTSPCCCTGPRRSGCSRRCPPAGKLSVVAEVADIQDKGEGKNAIVMLKATGTDPDSGKVIAETLTTAVIRGEGGFGGQPGQRPVAPQIPDREPDAKVALPTREDQAADLPAVRRPQPTAQRSVVRPEAGRLPEADPARAVHLRRRGQGAGRRTRRRRRDKGHGRRRAVHLAGVSRRDADDVDLAHRVRAGGVPHRGVESGWVRRAPGARGRHRRVPRLSYAGTAVKNS